MRSRRTSCPTLASAETSALPTWAPRNSRSVQLVVRESSPAGNCGVSGSYLFSSFLKGHGFSRAVRSHPTLVIPSAAAPPLRGGVEVTCNRVILSGVCVRRRCTHAEPKDLLSLPLEIPSPCFSLPPVPHSSPSFGLSGVIDLRSSVHPSSVPRFFLVPRRPWLHPLHPATTHRRNLDGAAGCPLLAPLARVVFQLNRFRFGSRPRGIITLQKRPGFLRCSVRRSIRHGKSIEA